MFSMAQWLFVLEPREAFSWLPVLRGFVSLSGLCACSGCLERLFKFQDSFLKLPWFLFHQSVLCIFAPFYSSTFWFFSCVPNVLTEGSALLSWPLPPVPTVGILATGLQWNCPFQVSHPESWCNIFIVMLSKGVQEGCSPFFLSFPCALEKA